MKLHLPKLLRNAVLACFAAVSGIVPTVGTASLAGAALAALTARSSALESATFEKLTNFSLAESFSISARVGDNYYDVSYDAETGLLTGISGKNGLDVNMKTSWKQDDSWNNADQIFVAYADRNPGNIDDTTGDFGLFATKDGQITGKWQAGRHGATVSSDALTALGKNADLTIILSNTGGVTLKNGQTDLYANGGLKSGGTPDTNIRLNKNIINSVAFVSASATTYSSGGISIEKYAGQHENVTLGEVAINGGDNNNGATINAAGSDIFVGGSGLLFLQTWNAGALELNNDIYLGSSTHQAAADRGVIEFGNDSSNGYTSTLGGNIYVLEDSSIGARGSCGVIISGDITDRKMLDGSDSSVGRTLTVKSKVKGDVYTISGNVTVNKLVLESAGVTLSGSGNELNELSMDKDSSLTITETGALSVAGSSNVNSSIVNEGSLSLGGQMTIDSLRDFDFEYTDKGTLSNGTHGYRTGEADYKIVIGGENSSLQLGENFALNAIGKDFTTDDYRLEDGTLILNTVDTDTRYEIESGCKDAIVYDATEGNDTTAAVGFILEDGTTLQLNKRLQNTVTKGISIADGASATVVVASAENTPATLVTDSVKLGKDSAVNYVVDTGRLEIKKDAVMSSITVTNGSTAEVVDATAVLGSHHAPVEVTLSKEGNLAFANGNASGARAYIDATVKGKGTLTGSYYGNALNVQGAVTGGEGSVLSLAQRSGSDNSWKLSADITGGMAVSSSALVTLGGENTYTGGTTITGGKLISDNATALGSGRVTVTGGELVVNSNLLLGSTLKVDAGASVTVALDQKIVLGSLDGFVLTAGSEPTANGLAGMTYKIIDAAEGATLKRVIGATGTTEDLSVVRYLGKDHTLIDGELKLENIYYVVDTAEYGMVPMVKIPAGEEGNLEEVEKRALVYVGADATLTVGAEVTRGVANTGTVLLKERTYKALNNITNSKDGVVYLVNDSGENVLSFTGDFAGGKSDIYVATGTKEAILNHTPVELYAAAGQNGAGHVYSTAGMLTVLEDATLDLQTQQVRMDITLSEGSTLKDSGAGFVGLQANTGQVVGSVTVTGDATITIAADTTTTMRDVTKVLPEVTETAYNDTATLKLGSYTLTKNGLGTLQVDNLNVIGNGMIAVQEGALRLYSSTDDADTSAPDKKMGKAANVTIALGAASLQVDTSTTIGKISSTGGVSKLSLADGVELVLGSDTFIQTSGVNTITIGENETATLNLAAGTTLEGPKAVTGGTLVLSGSGSYKQTTVQGGTGDLLMSDAYTGKVTVTENGGLSVVSLGSASEVKVESKGSLSVEGDVTAKVVNSGTLTVGGSISGSSFISDGGVLELTGADSEIIADSIKINGTTLKGSWSSTGAEIGSGVTLDADKGKVTLKEATLNAQVKVSTGTLVLSGETTLGSGFQAVSSLEYADASQNGFARDIDRYADVFVVLQGAEVKANNLTVDEAASIVEVVNGAGSIVVDNGLGQEYWVTTSETTYNDDLVLVNAEGENATGFALNGGTLNVAKELGTLGIRVTDENGAIYLGQGQSLSSSALSGTGKATIMGDGTYNIGTNLVLGENAELSSTDWSGLVSSSATEVVEDITLALGQQVEFSADALTLGAKMSTAGQLTMGSTLNLSTHKACLSAGTLVVRGGDALVIGMDAVALSDATAGTFNLMSLGNSFDKKLLFGEEEITDAGLDIAGTIGRDGLYTGKLSWDGQNLQLEATLRDGVTIWNSAVADFGVAEKWNAETITDTDVAFIGGGSSTVEVVGSTAIVKEVIVSNHTDASDVAYTFTGESIEAESLSVNYGAVLTVENVVKVSGDTQVSRDAVLAVSGADASLETNNLIATDCYVSVEDGSSLKAVGSIEAGLVEVSEESALEAASIATTYLVNSGEVIVDGVLTATAPAAVYSLRSAVPTGGIVENTGDMTVGGVDAAGFVMSSGTLEITSDAGFKADYAEITGGTLVAATTAWGIDGATIGGVTVEGDKQLTLSNVALTNTIQNDGQLALSGVVDVSAFADVESDVEVFTDLDGSTSETGNGYLSGAKKYSIATGNAVNTTGAEWSSGNDSSFEYKDGILTEKLTFDWSTYVVNAALTYDEAFSNEIAANNTTYVSAEGGTLDIESAMTQKLLVAGAGAVVNVNAEVAQEIALSAGKLNINSTVNGIQSQGGVINLGSGASGEVKVSGTEATITGGSAAATVAIASGVEADLNVTGTTVKAASEGVTLTGKLSDGELAVAEKSVLEGDLELDSKSTLRVIATSKETVLDRSQIESISTTGVAELGGITNLGDVQVEGCLAYDKYFSSWEVDASGSVVATGRNYTYYSDKATADADSNGAKGLKLADEALLALNPQLDKSSELGVVLSALDQVTGEKAEELGASLVGASTAVLGMATMGDLDRQLRAIRNRTTSMGVNQEVANDAMPYFNAWISAEGDRSELAEDGTASGYEMNSWGGSVGFDVDFCPTVSAGIALTAMYGDLDTTGGDIATGNLDSYYVSVFARYCPSAWTHTFVGTIGTSDISLDRTVAGVQTSGETQGMSFGFMYEVGRVIAMNEDASTCLQPVFNVTWRHTSVDGYTEDGGDIALTVDEQTLDTVTFGVGARLQSVVGESMYNRSSILEARVLAKLETGDRSGSSDVTLAALPGSKNSVESAERGAFGLEAGIGLTIPTGQKGGSFFVDGSVELRSDYTNMNGTVGYRINF